MKVVTFVGTRPEIIRLSRVMARLDEHVEHVLVHTGQNWDAGLRDVFFEDLSLRRPDIELGVRHDSLGTAIGDIVSGSERVLLAERPDAMLVLGDTNSALSAVMGRRVGVPIFHMEAGNRCFDWRVPEETNRRIVDHVSHYNLCYTEGARANLLREGLDAARVFVTGSPMREVLDHYRALIDKSPVLDRLGLEPGRDLVASLHREENVDPVENLGRLVAGLNALAATHDLPVGLSTHPRTRLRLTETGLATDPRVLVEEPFGYLDYVRLQEKSRCVISDSGTISEESAILGFPAVTPREAMERPEALDAGSMTLVGLEPADLVSAVEVAVSVHESDGPPPPPPGYEVTNCSVRVLRLITGLAGLPGV
ncbi:MAG: UDP-N-acetylglucosamine 2-epimerase (non-hydrolyzing) [Acidimicrobiia bacterium]|nr:UDP-N-acetylglucosamine 2-epimerase (non-hydrolyzing) [Acidimicrobiia bacterium]